MSKGNFPRRRLGPSMPESGWRFWSFSRLHFRHRRDLFSNRRPGDGRLAAAGRSVAQGAAVFLLGPSLSVARGEIKGLISTRIVGAEPELPPVNEAGSALLKSLLDRGD